MFTSEYPFKEAISGLIIIIIITLLGVVCILNKVRCAENLFTLLWLISKYFWFRTCLSAVTMGETKDAERAFPQLQPGHKHK